MSNGNLPAEAVDPVAEEAATWFVRLRRDGIGERERQRFDAWLGAADRHRQEYENFGKIWGSLDRLERPRSQRKRGRALLAVLCAAGALAMAGADLSIDAREQTRIGETRHLVLADGSQIDLDADSRLRVEYTPWQRRIVLEHGQVLFKVADGSLRPFVVEAGNGRLRDIGTTFNVQEDRGKVTVAVQEGEVEITLAGKRESRRLGGGQQASYRADAITPAVAVEPQRVDAWRQDRWYFAGASLGEVVREINRQHARPVVLAGDDLDNYHVSGVFARSDRAGLLKALCAVLPLRAEEGADATLLRAR